jgi:hypothetical protein
MINNEKPADPGDEIRRIQNEYEQRQSPTEDLSHLPKDSLIGSIWMSPDTNEMFVCNGRINGEAKWTRVSPQGVWV